MAETIEIHMARLEGAYQQINERLGALEQRLTAEIAALRSEIRGEIRDHRHQTSGQFYWLLTFVLGSILIPILRDLNR
ncbi:MAG: hypothetical protein ACRD1T_20140 [Acidimicrobiia bacterium]|jgi:hypothetical protein